MVLSTGMYAIAFASQLCAATTFPTLALILALTLSLSLSLALTLALTLTRYAEQVAEQSASEATVAKARAAGD